MEKHQAGQEETLVDVRVGTDSLEVTHRPRGSPADNCSCFKCTVALATVMGLVIVALVAGFLLHFVMFPPSCNQDAPPLDDTAKVNTAYKLKKSDEQGIYDIFTVDKAGTYIIDGWVKFSDFTSEDVSLIQTFNKRAVTIQKKNASKTEIFFLEKVRLANGNRISIKFLKSTYTDSTFHFYKL